MSNSNKCAVHTTSTSLMIQTYHITIQFEYVRQPIETWYLRRRCHTSIIVRGCVWCISRQDLLCLLRVEKKRKNDLPGNDKIRLEKNLFEMYIDFSEALTWTHFMFIFTLFIFCLFALWSLNKQCMNEPKNLCIDFVCVDSEVISHIFEREIITTEQQNQTRVEWNQGSRAFNSIWFSRQLYS